MSFTKVPVWILVAVLFLALLTRVVCFVGLIGSDDLTYNRQAYAIASGTFTPQAENQAARIGLFLPVALLFKLFGIHEISSVAVPFLYSTITLGLICWMGMKHLGQWTGIVAVLLYAFLPIEIFHATILLPDLPSATWMTVSAVLFYASETLASPFKQKAGMVLSGMALGWAYLIKETSVFLGAFLFGYIVYQWWRRKRFSTGWIWFMIGVSLCVGFEFGYYAWATGTPFFRYVAVQTARNGSIYSGHSYGATDLAVRLTLHLFYFLFHVPDFSLLYVFALAGGIYSLWKKPPFISFLTGWLFAMLALYNFAPASLSSYDPLLLFHRFFLSTTFPATLIGAWFLQEAGHVVFSEQRQDLFRMRLALCVPTCPLFIVNLVWFSWLTTGALLVSVGLIALAFAPSNLRQVFRRLGHPQQLRIGVTGILLIITMLPGIILAARGERLRKGLTCERELLPVFGQSLQHLIYTDRRTQEILAYLYQYRYDDQIMDFYDANTVDLGTVRNAYVVANWERLFFLSQMYQERIPEILYQPPKYWRGPLKLEGNVNPCLVYWIP